VEGSGRVERWEVVGLVKWFMKMRVDMNLMVRGQKLYLIGGYLFI
jgi:hypothetical protein